LRYNDDCTKSLTGATPAYYVFSANGLYDPDITSTGHQPLGFDQLMTFYNYYVVLRSRIRIVARNMDGGAFIGVALRVSSSSSGPNTWEALIENGGLKYMYLSFFGGAQGIGEISEQVDIARWNTIPDLLDNPSWQGDVANNPSKQTYFLVSFYSPDGGAPTAPIFSVTIEYDVLFRQAISQSGS